MSGYRSESLTYSDKNYRCIGVCWWNGPPGGIEGSAPDSRQTSSRPQPSSYGTTQFTLQAPPRRADPFSLLCGRSAAVRPPPAVQTLENRPSLAALSIVKILLLFFFVVVVVVLASSILVAKHIFFVASNLSHLRGVFAPSFAALKTPVFAMVIAQDCPNWYC